MNNHPKELVVISGKGGTGKTTITGGLAVTGPAKVLADCDVDAADLHLLLSPAKEEIIPFTSGFIAEINPEQCMSCGLCAEKCRFDAIALNDAGTYEVRREHCEGCGLCELVCPADAVSMPDRLCGEWYMSSTQHGPMVHAALGIGEENSGKLVTTVRRKSGDLAKELSANGQNGNEGHAPIVLTDGPPGIGCPVIASLTNAHMALMVTEPCLPAIHDLKRVIELTTHFRIPAAVVINKSDVNPTLTADLKKWCEEENVPVLAELGWTPDCTEAQLRGMSVVEHKPDTWRPWFESLWEGILSTMDNAK